MSSLEVGQVLSLKIRFNNTGQTAKARHPYLIVGVDNIAMIHLKLLLTRTVLYRWTIH